MYFRAQGFKPSASLKLLEQYEFLLNTDPKKMVFLYLHLSWTKIIIPNKLFKACSRVLSYI